MFILCFYTNIQIFNPNCRHFLRVSKFLSIYRLKENFFELFVKGFCRAVWVCLYFVVFLWMSTLCFSSNFVTSHWNSDPLSLRDSLGYLNTSPFLCIASNTNATSLAFLFLRALVTLYLHAISTPVHIYLYVFKDIIRYIEHFNLMLIIRFCYLVMGKAYFFRGRYMKFS